jgi:Uma2 family endonuclease
MSIALAAEPITEDAYFRLALADEERPLEWFRGRAREKPSMSAEHNDAMALLGVQLAQQLDRSQFRVRINAGRTRRPTKSVFIPDVMVLPTHLERAQRRGPGHLEVYSEPLPLVVEIWSPTTGDYDVDEKLPEYMQRGDLEIWRLHPHDRTLRGWRRRPDGSYGVANFHGGRVRLAALPHVIVDFDALFEDDPLDSSGGTESRSG